ncbi:MAG: hypothetical protein PHG91_08690 [Syntrophales bacterium]|nr:hypothetical protein [Syntrophales bacterium]MDD5233459.1 hypothetical protein [Syntrophales bacterium]MDD5532772.1 hypothetical protein [Syntrophales bacterium]
MKTNNNKPKPGGHRPNASPLFRGRRGAPARPSPPMNFMLNEMTKLAYDGLGPEEIDAFENILKRIFYNLKAPNFPMITAAKCLQDLDSLALDEDVRKLFLRDNARRVFGLP